MKLPAPALLAAFAAVVLSPIAAEDLYVRARAAGGANTGADWTNAWNGFDSIVWGEGPGRLGPGDTCWLGGGEYAAPLTIGASGAAERPIRLLRARAGDAAAVSAAGWDPLLDAPVMIVGQTAGTGIAFEQGLGSYVTIDGRTPAGISVRFANGGRGVEFDGPVPLTDITLRSIEAAGPGPVVQVADTRGFDLTLSAMLTNITLTHCSAHHADTLLQVSASTNLLVEHCDFHHAGALNAATFHPNAVYLATVRDLVFRYNRIHDHDAEGLFFGDPGNVGALIHGNVFYQGASARDSGRGIEFDRTAETRDFIVVNNTFVDLPLPGVNFGNGRPHLGAYVLNNLFVACGADFGPAAHDHNYLPTSAGEPHGVVGDGAGLFADDSRFDYRLTAGLGPGSPRDRAAALGAEFAVDPDGRPRGADGAWDIGAYEAVEPAVEATPANPPSPAPAPEPTTGPPAGSGGGAVSAGAGALLAALLALRAGAVRTRRNRKRCVAGGEEEARLNREIQLGHPPEPRSRPRGE